MASQPSMKPATPKPAEKKEVVVIEISDDEPDLPRSSDGVPAAANQPASQANPPPLANSQNQKRQQQNGGLGHANGTTQGRQPLNPAAKSSQPVVVIDLEASHCHKCNKSQCRGPKKIDDSVIVLSDADDAGPGRNNSPSQQGGQPQPPPPQHTRPTPPQAPPERKPPARHADAVHKEPKRAPVRVRPVLPPVPSYTRSPPERPTLLRLHPDHALYEEELQRRNLSLTDQAARVPKGPVPFFAPKPPLRILPSSTAPFSKEISSSETSDSDTEPSSLTKKSSFPLENGNSAASLRKRMLFTSGSKASESEIGAQTTSSPTEPTKKRMRVPIPLSTGVSALDANISSEPVKKDVNENTVPGRLGASTRRSMRARPSESVVKGPESTVYGQRGPKAISKKVRQGNGVSESKEQSVRRVTRLSKQATEKIQTSNAKYTDEERARQLVLGSVVWVLQKKEMKTGRIVGLCSNGSFTVHRVDGVQQVVPVGSLRLDSEFKPYAPTDSHDNQCSTCTTLAAGTTTASVHQPGVQSGNNPSAPPSNKRTPSPATPSVTSDEDDSSEEQDFSEGEQEEEEEEENGPQAGAGTGGRRRREKVKEPDTSGLKCVVCGRNGHQTASKDICYRMVELDEGQATYLRKNKAGWVVRGSSKEMKLGVHEYCLFFMAGLDQDWSGQNPLHLGGVTYSVREIASYMNKVAKKCDKCRQPGATIKVVCSRRKCKQMYHYPCVLETGLWCNYTNGDVYCPNPDHTEKPPLPPSYSEPCVICSQILSSAAPEYPALPTVHSSGTGYKHRPPLECPQCHTWTHFECMHYNVYTRGALGSKCCHCQCTDQFEEAMKRWGIRITKGHQPTWETDELFVPYFEVHYTRDECGAVKCLHRNEEGEVDRGEYDEMSDEWRRLGCDTCTSGTGHAQCATIQMNERKADKWSCLQCTSKRNA